MITVTNTGRSPRGISTMPARGLYQVVCTAQAVKPSKNKQKMALHLTYRIVGSFLPDAAGKLVQSNKHVNQEDQAMILLQDGQNPTADEIRESDFKALGVAFGLVLPEQLPPKGTPYMLDETQLVNRPAYLLFDPAPMGAGRDAYPERRFFTKVVGDEFIVGTRTITWPWDTKNIGKAAPGMTMGGPTAAANLMPGGNMAPPGQLAPPTGAPAALPVAGAQAVYQQQPAAIPANGAGAPTAAAAVAGLAPGGAPATQQWGVPPQ